MSSVVVGLHQVLTYFFIVVKSLCFWTVTLCFIIMMQLIYIYTDTVLFPLCCHGAACWRNSPPFFSGIIAGLGVVGKNLAAGLIMIFVGIFFALLAVISFAVLVKVSIGKKWRLSLVVTGSCGSFPFRVGCLPLLCFHSVCSCRLVPFCLFAWHGAWCVCMLLFQKVMKKVIWGLGQTILTQWLHKI